MPNTFVRWEHAWAGAMFASVGLELSQKVLALYLSHVPIYSTIYGAFASVPIFLVWMYVSWLIVLMGAVVAAYTPSLLSRVKRWPDAPGHRFALVLAVLKAGGFKEFADDRRVQVSRMEGGRQQKTIIDVKEILRTGNLQGDLLLQDGDRINVPRVLGKF